VSIPLLAFLFVAAVACESVPDLRFAPEPAGDPDAALGTTDAQRGDGASQDGSATCPRAAPPNGVCCGAIACVDCTASTCADCVAAGCGAGLICCLTRTGNGNQNGNGNSTRIECKSAC
jgi:hypothetical protein